MVKAAPQVEMDMQTVGSFAEGEAAVRLPGPPRGAL
jgi:hypothetical protein